METYATLLAVTEIQIKTAWQDCHIPIKLAKII